MIAGSSSIITNTYTRTIIIMRAFAETKQLTISVFTNPPMSIFVRLPFKIAIPNRTINSISDNK